MSINPKSDYNNNFAQPITTKLQWEDLVLDPYVMQGLQEIISWVKHGQSFSNQVKQGYATLFDGPPGTGKTLSATLIGKATGNEVIRVDLSLLVSKYIGETEKNLSNIFDTAQLQNVILFFDEADALFGKRTEVKDANDRYANEAISYLLQRIATFPGLIILATNLNVYIKGAEQLFQSVIHFPIPDANQRLQLWKNAFTGVCKLAPQIDLSAIAINHELTGGSIINVLRYCALAILKRNDTIVTEKELMEGIDRELGVGS